MTPKTIYLITGANRGIGFGIVSILLQRANTTVVATVRNETTGVAPLKALPKADNSDLIITYLSIPTTSTTEIETSHKALTEDLKARDIKRIDVLIANAGSGTCFRSTVDTPFSSIAIDFCANTLGPIALYQTLLPFLKDSTNAKFVIIGSILGSIGAMMPGAPTLSYGTSKAAVHYEMRRRRW
ncbi:putative aflatoxin biosynthesis ketoreductase nor-1 protein [Botrytis fragariae]|uniref:Putative aflatoxin biosynthesis ketoreductase nor-1 protein n=1 Tax=Botrytis fragariae TaxID=1964551 RepID=A0A8H6B3N7_9HELO|nr:putative aflatoxin biosynthesis ketoreductase nor-1 protein [Botrytis fragariae]KAF5878590.1 putative aflatoxin biosynthesis ketoreductase nor-1 protein [Botrytis fragariae]